MAHIDSAKALKSSKMFFGRAGNDPYFDWGTILVVSFVVALIFIALSARLFIDINVGSNNGGGTAAETGAPAASAVKGNLDTADLVSLINIFQSKKAQGTVYDATYPGPSDPAIPIKGVGKPSSSAAGAASSATVSK